MNTKKHIFSILVLATVAGFVLVAPALAENNQNGEQNNSSVLTGTVIAITGNTISVAKKQNNEDNGTLVVSAVFLVDATNAKITKNGVAGVIANIAIGDKVSVQGTVVGANITATTIIDGENKQSESENDSNKMSPAVVGKVSAISGNTITVVSNRGQNTVAQTTFTVDATNAKILRGETVITVSSIAVGDNVVVQGTVAGANVVATKIRDGKVGNGNESDNNQALLQIQGNGQPIVVGTISAITGSTITITNSSNVTYTIDATNAKIVQGKNIVVFAVLKVGDTILVQGTVNGTAIVASTIIDQAKVANNQQGNKEGKQNSRGFFRSIGDWFRRLFGF